MESTFIFFREGIVLHKERIKAFIESDSFTPMTRENIAVLLCVPESDMDEFNHIIDELTAEGTIICGKKKRCFSRKAMGLLDGVFRSTSKGFGFVTEESGDIHISASEINGALNGDRVLVKITKSQKNHNSREGSIIRVLRRANNTIVGTYIQERGYGILVPDNDKLPDEIFVEQRYSKGALNGQKVVAIITDYDTPSTSLSCHITEVLGFPNDFGIDVLSIIKAYECPMDFSKEALAEAEGISLPSEDELSGRLDLTEELIITIDGEDTKDIDDAVSVQKTETGYRLGVHIADVSHYVLPGTPLDKDAFLRGTSVYLADRVIPMLPVKLSNDVCSLNEGALRLTMSVIIDFGNEGNVLSSSFHKSYIKSRARMTYNNIKRLIEKSDVALYNEYSYLFPMLDYMNELYMLLQKNTVARGSIDFNIPEAKAVFDKNGKTVQIVLREGSFANKIIEEFMVAANSEVAKFLCETNTPSLYRVHEEPNKERLANTLNFIYNKGYDKTSDITAILNDVKGTPQEAPFSTMLLRSMAKAEYSTLNKGHYGLALENYCHFTSPIRRYPDLFCHRALKASIENDSNAKKYLSSFGSEAAETCTERENSAAFCERDVLDLKKAEYMQSFIGDDFDGVISSVTGFGFFVMLPNTVEGLVRVETLKDDYYIFDEKSLSLTGERTGHMFNIGDTVKVRLVAASTTTRRIDFTLLEGGINGGRKRTKKNAGSKQKRSPRVLHRGKVRGRH